MHLGCSSVQPQAEPRATTGTKAGHDRRALDFLVPDWLVRILKWPIWSSRARVRTFTALNKVVGGLTCGLPECQGLIAIHPLVSWEVVDSAVGSTDLYIVTVPGVLGQEGVRLLVQTDDDKLPQVLLALYRVVIHLHKTWGLSAWAS